MCGERCIWGACEQAECQQDNGRGLTMVVSSVTFLRGDIMGVFSFLLYILLG